MFITTRVSHCEREVIGDPVSHIKGVEMLDKYKIKIYDEDEQFTSKSKMLGNLELRLQKENVVINLEKAALLE